MLQKWTQDEDRELVKLVKKYGTTNWNVIRTHFKSDRSRDSVIKRWHCRLKHEKPLEQQKHPKKDKVKKAPAPIRKETQPVKKVQTSLSRSSRYALRHPEIKNAVSNESVQSSVRSQSHIDDILEAEQSEQVSASKNHGYKLNWNRNEDERLKSLVLDEGITDWGVLAGRMGCSVKEVMKRWKEEVYNLIKLEDKVGGFLKYSAEEDAILGIGYRNKLEWSDLMNFLPGRSEFSIEARWRRSARPEMQMQIAKNKHFMMREFLKKVLQKRRSQKEPYDERTLFDLGRV